MRPLSSAGIWYLGLGKRRVSGRAGRGRGEERGENSHGLPRVGRAGDAKTKLKVERLDEAVAEVVTLDHAEVSHRLPRPHLEDQLGPDGREAQDVLGELVGDGAEAVLGGGGGCVGGRSGAAQREDRLTAVMLAMDEKSMGKGQSWDTSKRIFLDS